MELRTIDVPLKGFGAAPNSARLDIATLNGRDRLKRAATVLAIFLAIAVIAIPIPLVHFGLVPGALLLGLVFFWVRLGQREVFQGAEGTCPFCGTEQEFPLMGRLRLPKEVHCASCHRSLTLGE